MTQNPKNIGIVGVNCSKCVPETLGMFPLKTLLIGLGWGETALYFGPLLSQKNHLSNQRAVGGL